MYNQFYDGKSGEIRSREVNGRLVLEGSLRIHWGVQGVIHLKEDDDQRTLVTVRKRNSYRKNSDFESDDDISRDSSINNISDCSLDAESPLAEENSEKFENDANSFCDSLDSGVTDTSNSSEMLPKSLTLPPKLDLKNMEWDELDELLVVERKVDESEKLYQTMPVPLPSQNSVDSSNSTMSGDESTRQESNEHESSKQDGGCITSSKREDIDSESNKKEEIGHETNKKEDTEGNVELNKQEYSSQITPTPVLNGIIESPLDELKENAWQANSNHLNRSMSGPDCLERIREPHSPDVDSSSHSTVDTSNEDVVLRRAAKTGSTAIKRRSGNRRSRTKIKRRCSINGHFYDRETSFFTPPHGSQTSVWVTSLVNTQEVINLMLEKYKVDSDPRNFALFVVRDNGGK